MMMRMGSQPEYVSKKMNNRIDPKKYSQPIFDTSDLVLKNQVKKAYDGC